MDWLKKEGKKLKKSSLEKKRVKKPDGSHTTHTWTCCESQPRDGTPTSPHTHTIKTIIPKNSSKKQPKGNSRTYGVRYTWSLCEDLNKAFDRETSQGSTYWRTPREDLVQLGWRCPNWGALCIGGRELSNRCVDSFSALCLCGCTMPGKDNWIVSSEYVAASK